MVTRWPGRALFGPRRECEALGGLLAGPLGGGQSEVLVVVGALDGLGDGDARSLLVSTLGIPLDARVRDRIVAETRGNPLALLELPRGLTLAKLAVGFGFSVSTTVPRRIEETFQRRLGELPPETRRLLLVAAAEPVGDPVLMWRAAEQLGIGIEADAAESEGWLEVGARGDVSPSARALGLPSGGAARTPGGT
jgi:hypothetical protein